MYRKAVIEQRELVIASGCTSDYEIKLAATAGASGKLFCDVTGDERFKAGVQVLYPMSGKLYEYSADFVDRWLQECQCPCGADCLCENCPTNCSDSAASEGTRGQGGTTQPMGERVERSKDSTFIGQLATNGQPVPVLTVEEFAAEIQGNCPTCRRR
jgi:hypothetical protein